MGKISPRMMRAMSAYESLKRKRADQRMLAANLHASEKDIRKLTEKVTQIIDETNSPLSF